MDELATTGSNSRNSKLTFQMQTKARKMSVKSIAIQRGPKIKSTMLGNAPESCENKLKLVNLNFSKFPFRSGAGIVINKQTRTPQVMRSISLKSNRDGKLIWHHHKQTNKNATSDAQGESDCAYDSINSGNLGPSCANDLMIPHPSPSSMSLK